MATGRVEVVPDRDGVAQAHARDLGYFSRLADAATFTREAWVELHRAGIAPATTVCGVMDGADWEQTFLDVHRPDAVRILDFPHAVEYLTKAAQTTWCLDATKADVWVQQQAHILKHDEHGAATVLKALAQLPVDQATDRRAALQARDTALNYLTKRLNQIQYAAFCVFRRMRTPVSAEAERAFRLKSNSHFDAEQRSEPAAPVEAMSTFID